MIGVVTEYIRQGWTKLAEQRLAALIVEGLESGAPIPGDDDYWKSKREALVKRTIGVN